MDPRNPLTRVDVVLDTSAGVYDVYVDGAKIGSGASSAPGVGLPAAIKVRIGAGQSDVSSFALDDVSVQVDDPESADTLETVGIGTDRAASVITRRAGRQLEVAVADPTHSHGGDLIVDLDPRRVGCARRLIEADPRIQVESMDPELVRLRVDVADAGGRSLQAVFDCA